MNAAAPTIATRPNAAWRPMPDAIWFWAGLVFVAVAFGAAISIPVFYQQWRLSREISINDPGGDDGVGGNLLSMLLPYPLVQGTLPNIWGSLNLQWNGRFYYFGSVLLVAFLAAVAVLAWRRIGARSHVANTVDSSQLQVALVVPAVVAFLLALGESGGLWRLIGAFTRRTSQQCTMCAGSSFTGTTGAGGRHRLQIGLSGCFPSRPCSTRSWAATRSHRWAIWPSM